MLIPGQIVPTLNLPRVGGGVMDLHQDLGAKGALLIVYRGLHCPLCIKQLTAVAVRLDEFAALDVAVLAVSVDTAEKAAEFVEKASCGAVTVGHSLPARAARDDWGLWISSARAGTREPKFFAEPGLFLINGDATLQTAWIQSAPFARPTLDDVLACIAFQQEKQYPPRGTFDGDVTG